MKPIPETKIEPRKCNNCGSNTTRGMFCHVCTIVLNISDMIESRYDNPSDCLKFIQSISEWKTPYKMKIESEKIKARSTFKLACQFDFWVKKYDYVDQVAIFKRAIDRTKARAEAMLKHRENKAAAFNAQEVISGALGVMRDEGRLDRQNVDREAARDKDGRAYAGFDPTESEPEDMTGLFD